MPKISDMEALELIARLPDDTPLTTAEAAVFLRVSKSTLDKMRRPDATNEGPPYSQGGGLKSKGSNQKVLYFKGDLKTWLQTRKVANTFDAAIRKGQLTRNMDEPMSFWTTPQGVVEGLVEDTDVDLFFERCGVWGIEWMLPEEAAILRETGCRLAAD